MQLFTLQGSLLNNLGRSRPLLVLLTFSAAHITKSFSCHEFCARESLRRYLSPHEPPTRSPVQADVHGMWSFAHRVFTGFLTMPLTYMKGYKNKQHAANWGSYKYTAGSRESEQNTVFPMQSLQRTQVKCILNTG